MLPGYRSFPPCMPARRVHGMALRRSRFFRKIFWTSRMAVMTAEVLSIGNEVLSGRTLDTNFQFLARLLEEAGARMCGHQAVPDEEGAIADALKLAFSRADLVVTTGGL